MDQNQQKASLKKVRLSGLVAYVLFFSVVGAIGGIVAFSEIPWLQSDIGDVKLDLERRYQRVVTCLFGGLAIGGFFGYAIFDMASRLSRLAKN